MTGPEVREIRTCVGSARDKGWLVGSCGDDELPSGAFVVVEYGADRRLFCSLCAYNFDEGDPCEHLKAAVDYHNGTSQPDYSTPRSEPRFSAGVFID